MKIQGGCYCGEIKYLSLGQPEASIQCHCRECRYSTGGPPNTVGLTKRENFKVRKGSLNSFVKNSNTPRRYFCPNCGTHIYAESPARPDHLVLKIGTLDDIASFFPQQAQFLIDGQPFDAIPIGVPTYEKRKPKG